MTPSFAQPPLFQAQTMIVVVEGASAAGKTTWCRSHFPQNTVEEALENIAAPDLLADPAEVAQFWVNHAVENWQRALKIEHDCGIAFCDGDPFHLYYSWALWKSGALSSKLFELESELYRGAFEARRIGFADYVLWLDVPIDDLRRRARSDTTRRRKRHEMYLALIPWMKAWFQQRERLLPQSVRVMTEEFAVEKLCARPESHRFDTAVVDKMLDGLRLL